MLGRLLRFHSIDDITNEFQISFGNTLPMTRVIDDESGIHFQCAKDIEGHDKTIDIWPLLTFLGISRRPQNVGRLLSLIVILEAF